MSRRTKRAAAAAGSDTSAQPVATDAGEQPVRACCGAQMRGRHKKGCEEAGRIKPFHQPAPQRRRLVGNRRPFSEPTYKVVKNLLDDEGFTVDGISAEKGLDLSEVRRCNLADDYEDYLTIA